MARDDTELEQRIAAVRRFNRFYTPLIGLLHEGYLDSPFSLTQVRVLYELAERERLTAGDLARGLLVDRGYLSRILRSFTELGLIDQAPSDADGRRRILSLTEHGRDVFGQLDRRSRVAIGTMLGGLPVDRQQRLVGAMGTIEGVLGDRPAEAAPYLLRSPGPGDLGWVVQRHGALYAREFGWDATFEGLVAEIVAGFARGNDPKYERCWIAEMEDANVGSVFCVKKSDTVAQLRLLLVEPHARGSGIGRRLVDECVRFARSAGYRELMLWTNAVLVSARRIYEAAGFHLVKEERHHSFGHDLVGQNWQLGL